ncbi:MAG TPA: LytR C-terminal domain-containing protein [Candidatus Saccharimonadales bacterium]|nr:LytR C-terminal domain-containing protein [Candidatus Saccharimonadales bacterium]
MKKNVHKETNSLKTVLLYFIVVTILICISLVIKAFYIYQQSKFDPAHEFVLAVVQQNKVKDIISFHPETQSISLLQLQDQNLPYARLAKDFGITTNGYIETQDGQNSYDDISSLMWTSIMHSADWHSDLTILDKLRLLFFAKNVSINNKSIQQISLTHQNPDLNTIIATALNDQDISSENVTIQIINTTTVSGLGQRLGKVLTNMGANVVDVTSSEKTQQQSTIAYFGNETYTVDRLQKFFGVTATKLTKQTIADIVITIGKDKEKTNGF